MNAPVFLASLLFVAHHTLSGADVRLPQTVSPRHYDVRLFPILDKGNFSILGQVSIGLECSEDTNRIVLHSADIVVDPQSVQVIERCKTDKLLQVEGIEYDTKLEFLIVHLNPKVKLTAGSNYTLSMSFVGNLTDQMRGFYRSVYTEDGTERYMASSLMQPTDARRALPCFDEPNLKATFTVTLGRHSDMISLSNMPLIDTTPMIGMENFFWDHFQPSVPMSTYLLAFAVANYAQVPSVKTKGKWNFNIYARSSAYNQTRYASDIGPRILSFFEDYFNISFPLPKQDMIAVPEFALGAMENWGLITYREKFLLYDETVSSFDHKELVIKVIAHELSHQWFGNLVTMEWWTDLWLNEGFASYAEHIGADHVEPDFKFLEQIVTFALHQAMNLDALESSHPVSVVVHHPSEIAEIFDVISYQKGAAIIRMLASFIGEDNFRKALFNFLDKRQYGNAVQDDLWNAFDNQAKVDHIILPVNVKTIMDTWTLKMGFPVVTIRRDYQSQNVSISQERFLLHKSEKATDDPTVYLWWVPLTYTTDYKTIGSTWLADSQPSKNLTLESEIGMNDWIIFNVDETGYYRVNYDAHNWKLIGQQLMTNHSAISVINRAQIMDDSLNLARVGLVDYETAFNLTEYLKFEGEVLPWESTFAALTYIDSMMWQKPGYDLLKKHFRNIMSPIFSSLGFRQNTEDSPLTSKLRLLISKWACYYGNEECIRQAIELYRQWMADPEDPTIVPIDVKSVVVSTAIREGGEREWKFAFDRYKKSNVASEKDTLLNALTSTREHDVLKRLLEMALNSTSGIRQQDGPDVMVAISQNHFSRPILFNFIKDNLDLVESSFSAFDALSRIIRSTMSSIHTDLDLKEFIKFRNEQLESVQSVTRTVQQSLDVIACNINWITFRRQNVVDWLQRQD